MSKKYYISAVGCLLLVALAFGAKQQITLRDGRQITGTVTKTSKGYRVTTPLGVMEFDKNQVVSVKDVIDPKDEFKKRLGKAKTAEQLCAVGEWAMDAGLLEEAKQALTAALKQKADYAKAKLLLRQVEARLRKGSTTRPVVKNKNDTKTVGGEQLRPEWLVSEKDIYRIRRDELRDDDVVVINFRNKVVERFIKSMQGRDEFKKPGAANAFRGLSRVRKVRYMRKWAADNTAILNDIVIKSDPKFMIEFRSKIWPRIARRCATASCHGGAKPKGHLKLFNIGGRNEKADYTNFIILAGFAKKGARMLDRFDPNSSLLLQYALPKEQAKFDHPVRILSPFKSRKDPGYRMFLKWIQSLKAPCPEYGLEYKPPFDLKLDFGGGSVLPSRNETTKPATQPGKQKDKDLPI